MTGSSEVLQRMEMQTTPVRFVSCVTGGTTLLQAYGCLHAVFNTDPNHCALVRWKAAAEVPYPGPAAPAVTPRMHNRPSVTQASGAWLLNNTYRSGGLLVHNLQLSKPAGAHCTALRATHM